MTCTLCPLHKRVKSVCIPGEGPSDARVVVLGEAPGEYEDKEGRPFVGTPGRLLRRYLRAVDLPVRMEYVVRCRPPGNRKPSKEEIQTCRMYLELAIEESRAEVVVALGGTAMRACGVKGAVLRNAGTVHPRELGERQVVIVPLASPSYVLRSPSYGDVWASGWNTVKGLLEKKEQAEELTVEVRDGMVRSIRTETEPVPETEVMGLDIETTGLDPARHSLLSWAVSDGTSGYSRWVDTPDDLEALRLDLSAYWSPKVVVHHAAFEGRWADMIGAQAIGLHDTMLMATRIEPGRPASLDALCARYLPEHSGWKTDTDLLQGQGISWGEMPRETLLRRNLGDAKVTALLYHELWNRLSPLEQSLHPQDVAMSLSVSRMAAKGMHLDREVLNNLGRNAGKVMETERAGLEQVGVNPASPKSVGEFLTARDVVMSLTPGKSPATGDSVLRKIGHNHPSVDPVLQSVLRFRSAQKILGTYCRGYVKRAEGDVLRSDMRFPGTTTWRPASSNPNLLNVPPSVRPAFTAPEGMVVLECDLSQAELRAAAALSGDEILCDAFRAGQDLHALTAQALTGADTVTPKERKRGKTVNFGTLYGGGAGVLHNAFVKIGEFLPMPLVVGYRRKFWQTYEGLAQYVKSQTELARAGERLACPEGGYHWSRADFLLLHPTDERGAERAVFNAVIQAIPPRIVSRTILRLEAEGWDVRLHTYDGLIAYVPRDGAVEAARRVREVMAEEASGDWWQGVPCPSDVKVGPSWGALEEVTE